VGDVVGEDAYQHIGRREGMMTRTRCRGNR
jgi:hypothetical protein